MPKIDISGSPVITSVKMAEQGSTPATPAAGYSAVYVKADGLYVIDDAGNVTGPLVSAAGGGGYTQGARVYNSGAISIAHNVAEALVFDSERYDTDSIHEGVTNPSRLTCTTTGKYMITGTIQFAANTTGIRNVYIRLNNTTNIVSVHANATSSGNQNLVVTTIYALTGTDYVELWVYQSSGGDLNVNASAAVSPEFMMQRIG